MKKILILFLLLVNLHIITDNGIFCVGIGGLSAQTMLEEQLDDVVVTGTTSVDCEWCRMTVLKSQLEFHQQSECPARTIECMACHGSYKAYEGHVCRGLRCSTCGNDASSCTCGPVVEGNTPKNDPPSGGDSKPSGGGTGSGTSYSQYPRTDLATFKEGLRKAMEDTKKIYGETKACNIGVQKAFNNIFHYLPQELNCRASDMIINLRSSENWKKISLNEASSLAANGCFVIVGWYNNNGSGHVVVGHPNSGANGDLKVMDCGSKPAGKNLCQGWHYSFGTLKRESVEYFVYIKK